MAIANLERITSNLKKEHMFKHGDVVEFTQVDWKRFYYDDLSVAAVPPVDSLGRVTEVNGDVVTIQVVEKDLQGTSVIRTYKVLYTELH